MSNKDLWKRVFTTDPKAVKPISGKDYQGNSPKPYWIVERLTDEFGPCGIGWGYTIDSERFERFNDTDTLHVARVTLWYEMDGKRGTITQMGQTKASFTTGQGKFRLDEDAPKKSVTDALVKCASYLGFAGDIFSGRWDDSKYVAQAGKDWDERRKEADPKATPMPPAAIADWCAKIGEAADIEALTEARAAAWSAAEKARDKDAYKAFRATASKRYQALTASAEGVPA